MSGTPDTQAAATAHRSGGRACGAQAPFCRAARQCAADKMAHRLPRAAASIGVGRSLNTLLLAYQNAS